MRISSLLLLLSICLGLTLQAQQVPVYSPKSFPDEEGFQARSKDGLQLIANMGFGKRQLSPSKCPDTGLPVKTMAVEGDTIISPYTGRKYVQGPTGFFGAKKRNANGDIIKFGGDPLKYDLPPATASLMLNPDDALAKAYVSIPGMLEQQFFFSAVNWIRFKQLCGHLMPERWHDSLKSAVANYVNHTNFNATTRRIQKNLTHPHNLVGEEGELLGGNPKDGGTENHKTMWRTSGWLYSEMFGPEASISGFDSPTAKRLITEMLQDYLKKCLSLGNGEYMSSIYYPYSINGYLNLYDNAQDPEMKKLAQAQLDYYLASYSLKTLDGVVAGAQRRGYLSKGKANSMETLLSLWMGNPNWPQESSRLADKIMLHSLTTDYRPNRVLYNLFHKKVALPYEAEFAYSSYHLRQKNVHQESLYQSENFALANTTIDYVNNAGQQVCWSLVIRDKERPIHIGGAHPIYTHGSGHSPYMQSIHKKGSLIMLTGPTKPKPTGDLSAAQQARYEHAEKALLPTEWPSTHSKAAWEDFFKQAKHRAESWLFVPPHVEKIQVQGGKYYLDAGECYVAILPIGEAKWIDLPKDSLNHWVAQGKTPLSSLKQFQILVVSGEYSGYVLEVAEKADHKSLAEFISTIETQAQLSLRQLPKGRLRYRSIAGHRMVMQYRGDQLKPSGSIDGKALKYNKWANGGWVDSPYLKIKDGKMWVSDGQESYEINYQGEELLFTEP